MKLSVIVPVYNVEKYLRECLDSLAAQTLRDYELILVNDGSTDGSQALIDEYTARFPRLITAMTVTNGGQGRARNFGIERARGEYLGFVDSDDSVAPDMFEKLCAAADREAADVAVCGIVNSFADGRRETPALLRDGRDIALAGSASNKIFRRSAVGDIRFPEGLWYEDFDFSAKLICAADKTAYVDEALYIYRRGHESTMNNRDGVTSLDSLAVMGDLEPFFTGRGRRDDFEYLVINHVLLDSINRLSAQSSSEKKQVIKKLRAYVRDIIPDLSECGSFRREPRNRRIVMRLNYTGLDAVSRLLLRAKKAIK